MNKLLTTIFALAVASATGFSHAQKLEGNLANAEKQIAMCIGCHGISGYQATFPEVYKVPKISGQTAAYISAALHAYQKGDRKHPTMRGVAASLTEQDIADVAAYYEKHGTEGRPQVAATPREPTAAVAELLKKGACVTCHGANFAKPIDPSYPKIAGQNADYLYVALKSYKVENNANVGRNNGVMAGIAKQFSNAELKAMANYVGSLDGDLLVVPQNRFKTR